MRSIDVGLDYIWQYSHANL